MFERVLCVCFTLLLASSVFGADQVGRVALVIGNAAYKSSPLANPVNDAQDMAKSLRALGFDVVERTNITSKQIGRTLAPPDKKQIRPLEGVFCFYPPIYPPPFSNMLSQADCVGNCAAHHAHTSWQGYPFKIQPKPTPPYPHLNKF